MATGVALLGALAVARAEDAPRVAGPLPRAEAARIGAARNLGALVARLARERAARAADAAYRPYVPTLELHAGYDDAAPLPGTDDRTRGLDYRGTVTWSTTLGTVLGVEATSQQGTDEAPLPTDGAGVALTLTQPLLQGAGRAGAAAALDEAEIDARIERERFRQSLEDLLVEIDEAYWDLAFAQADVAVKTRSQERAKQQYEDTKENIRRGILAQGEIYVVEENLVFFQQQLRGAVEQRSLAQHRLARLLVLDPETPLQTTDDLSWPGRPLPTSDAAVHDGLEGNADLAARTLAVEKQQVEVASNEDQALPRLDLEGRLGLDGYGDLDHAWGEVGDRKYLDGRLGVTFSMPLGRGPVRAQAEAARLEAQRLQADLERARSEVRFDVRDRLTELQGLLERLELGRRLVELEELKLQAENQKYAAGLSTLADVVRFQRDLDDATIGLGQIQHDLLTKWSRLLAARGALHESLGIEVR
jgi:outer membrane protein TolC